MLFAVGMALLFGSIPLMLKNRATKLGGGEN
jgi:hypothetical protein